MYLHHSYFRLQEKFVREWAKKCFLHYTWAHPFIFLRCMGSRKHIQQQKCTAISSQWISSKCCKTFMAHSMPINCFHLLSFINTLYSATLLDFSSYSFWFVFELLQAQNHLNNKKIVEFLPNISAFFPRLLLLIHIFFYTCTYIFILFVFKMNVHILFDLESRDGERKHSECDDCSILPINKSIHWLQFQVFFSLSLLNFKFNFYHCYWCDLVFIWIVYCLVNVIWVCRLFS